MKVKILHDWMGITAGQILDMEISTAQKLIMRGTVEEVKPRKEKQIRKPPHDKMIREASNKRVKK